ncbi:MAG: branched-chain amino acid ABC transporter permease [Betaproteobacteria bacterium]|jgi:branched-chain amino acid transport system permease protein|nr:branched-chain amino acid ABC transporter permease [Betaproteobacteria bacterium]NBS46237.1 branched-chain amino acid ABC transporter permease [Betaproteobacteria bacterium]
MAEISASAGPRWGRVALIVLAALLLPFFVSNYTVFQLSMVVAYAIALVGLNLLTGFSGQISLGHGAFFAIGAYTAAIMMDRYELPYWATIPAAALVCLIAGFLFGLPALKLEGHYLALATYALAVALPQLLKFKHLEGFTGGVQGIVIIKPDPPIRDLFGIAINADRWLYLFSLAVALVMFWIGWNLIRGRIGRALIAIRDQPIAAASMGINMPMYKSLAFGISALYTGVAGALSAILVAFVAPDSFNVLLSITLMVGMVIGGIATLSGAIWGAIFVQFIPNIADQISKAAPWAIYGVTLILFMYLMPGGIAGGLRMLAARLKALGARGAGAP